ncbi:MAG: hypothetical protein ACOYMG_19050, partial [Candidatus Methylumidiphilus sp.]
MDKDKLIELCVKDPSLLVEVCREVIDRLDVVAEDSLIGQMEAQLREISAAIDRLDKQGIAIPDVLRAEKTRLAAALGIQNNAAMALNQLVGEYEEILKDLKSRLGISETITPETRKPISKRQRLQKTDNKALHENIIQALTMLGGKARARDVIEAIGTQLDGKLLPGDLEWRESTNEFAWQNNAKWER